MKKIVCLLVCVVMVLSVGLAGCAQEAAPSQSAASQEPAASQELAASESAPAEASTSGETVKIGVLLKRWPARIGFRCRRGSRKA